MMVYPSKSVSCALTSTGDWWSVARSTRTPRRTARASLRHAETDTSSSDMNDIASEFSCSIVIEPSSRRSLLPLGDGLLAAAQQRLGQLPHHIADRAGVHVGLGDGDLVSGAADDLIEHLDVGAQHFLDGVVHGAGGDHGRDHHGAVLADAVLAVLGLGDQVGQPFGLD